MAYGEKQVGFTINDGVNVVTQEMEYGGKCFTVEVRISEKYGFVQTNITDHGTGDDLDLELQLGNTTKPTDELEAAVTSGDDEVGTLRKDGFYPC